MKQNDEWPAQILKKAKLVLILWYRILKFTSQFLWWAYYNIMLFKTAGDGATRVLIKENKQSSVFFLFLKQRLGHRIEGDDLV